MQIIFAQILPETAPLGIPLEAANNATAAKKAGCADVEVAAVFADDAESLTDQIKTLISSDTAKKAAVFFTFDLQTIALTVKVAEQLKKQIEPPPICVCTNSISSQDFCGYNTFDYVITGESETAVTELLSNLNVTKQTVSIQGKAQNCDNLFSPWLEKTLDPVDYNGVVWELSRGCPLPCPFCAKHSNNTKKRHIPLARLEKELDFFARKKVPDVFVADNVFNYDKERALKLLSLMQKKLPDAHYQFSVSADHMDKQLAQAFSRISCSLQINLVSSNPNVMKKCGMSFDKKQFARKISLLNDYGLTFGFNLVYGLPSDTLPSFRETLDYALSLYPNHLEFYRLSVIPGTKLFAEAESHSLKFSHEPPFFVQLTPTFSELDLLKAENLAFACSVFYTAGRAVPWFLSVIHPLRIKPSQFFSDFAEWLRCNNCAKSTGFNPDKQPHTEIEKIQLLFLELKYEEKKLSYAFPVVKDVVRLNGALSRLVGEGEETTLELTFHPDDILCGSANNVLAFVEEACSEPCTVRLFNNNGSPDYEILGANL